MTHAGWYLRRAVPWAAVLGCSAVAAVAAAALHRWPSASGVLLPAMLACCAAAAAFVFDEPDHDVTSVTPRAGWRRTARLAAAAVPLALWCTVVALRPTDPPLSQAGWWLVGAATILLTVGSAALGSRRRFSAPGPILSAVVGIAVLTPVVLGPLLDWGAAYPTAQLEAGVRTFWLATAAIGAAACAVALRPGPDR